MLMNKPDLLHSECFSKIKISLAEFEILEKEDRIRYIFEETSGLSRSNHYQLLCF